MGTKQLTLNQKAKYTPILIRRDFPYGSQSLCFYCEQRFIPSNSKWAQEWDHLNNNTEDSRPENLVWAHADCNEKKKYNTDWQILAQEKLNANVKWHDSESLGGRGKIYDKNTQPNEQIDANKTASQLTEEYLNERLLGRSGNPPSETELDFNETKDSLTFLHYKQYGHGSQNTFDRILKMLTSEAAPFDRDKRDGRMKIFRRCGQ